MKLLFLWTNLFISTATQIFAQGQRTNGLYPEIINLATRAQITANSTCGEYGQEIYCKLNQYNRNREPQCSVCDSRSSDPNRRHPPENAIDGTNSWWQSPSLASGWENEFVTITLDLQQIYQIAYVIVKSAVSPRPGNWILERSLDDITYEPWQYFALSDQDCMTYYGVQPAIGRANYVSDNQVLCTSQFSKINPLEGGEIHTSLVNGRPGSSGPSKELLEFTEARFIRLRLQKLQTMQGELQGRRSQIDQSVTNRYFYSIKDISIGGRCLCNGHADTCDLSSGSQECSCNHNTCGSQCEVCCPLFNHYPWKKGNEGVCVECNCHGHAKACKYDPEVDRDGLSLNIWGEYSGGGVCLNCEDHTTGINCEKCESGYYRPKGVKQDNPRACIPCNCEGTGVTGDCVPDDSQASLGLFSGSCICREGFVGRDCDQCADGYLNYPICEPCPCSLAGSKNRACDGECICKENVRGRGCKNCATGTFHLDKRNPLGCTSCFCSGVTDKCEAAKLPVYTVEQWRNWQVTDLNRRKVVEATALSSSMSIEHEKMSGFNAYYWLAPDDYLGARMTSYGQTLRMKVSWVTLRGDTSGRATKCPEIILEGAGYRIAYGGRYHRGNSVNLEIPLYEQDWYHFPKDLADIDINQDVASYNRGRVSREEMMAILSSLDTLMIRARYSTVQAESILHNAILEYGKLGGGRATLVTGAVEKCDCPPGYAGLSCESCAPSYRRVSGKCIPCNCNNHVVSCDAETGACGDCLHHTVGTHCERCAEGFYGDATRGTPDDCQACLCPLGVDQNHFTPRCVANDNPGSSSPFRCLCPPGYEGNNCERCIDGYFGNPLVPGNFCQPCNCNGNVDPRLPGNCDRSSGECLKCLGNTAGWNCERCKENHYGDPMRGQCYKCDCHETGSTSMTCDERTGQCPCRNHYGGRQCDSCVPGRGDIAEGCPLCRCHQRGSMSDICDPITGQCPCKPGVAGKQCESCLPDHYGDMTNGCLRCSCHTGGSLSSTCDIVTGQCPCRPNIVGRTCNSCKSGYWGLSAGLECQKCQCNDVGSEVVQCDDRTGQCKCRPGVGGSGCDRCLPGYWGYSPHGCRICEPCDHPGKNCDPNSGRCICPSNTEGDRCERCSPGYWDYSADIGCRDCRCSGPGSLERQCDPRTGRCICRDGFEGPRCDRCTYGHYGYPNCRPCNCERAGTDEQRCAEGRCQCDQNGQCPCKPNVQGLTCNQCAVGTFGLAEENPMGCFSCFCFKRSNRCTQASLTWSQLALPGDRTLQLGDGENNLNITNQLYVIPETYGDITIGTSLPFLAPLYWQLPREFMRDKILSYNGYLRFRVQSHGSRKTFPEQIVQSYPIVSLQGNWRLVLEYYPEEISRDGLYAVRFHEKFWRKKNDPTPVTREEMMVALQNVQHILIQATNTDDFTSATLSDVTMDIAAEGRPSSSRRALGIEQCQCPDKYSGTSCQNPNLGFHRWFKENYITSTIVIDLVGESKPCNCNGRADTCDQETGVCQNCRDNTSGPHCEVCASGFYGNPLRGECKACACPSRQQNFAETCEADPYSEYICHCRKGYTGNKCERCAPGYYGNPMERGGSCKPCRCDPNGSLGVACDNDGTCRCRPGITGKDCSQCKPLHVVSQNGCISCVDGCIDVLLADVNKLIEDIGNVDVSGYVRAPYPGLNEIKNETNILRTQLNQYESREDLSQAMLLDFDLDYTAKVLLRRAERIKKEAQDNLIPSEDVKKEGQSLLRLILGLRFELENVVAALDNYALGESPNLSIVAALDEAEQLLRAIKGRNFDSFDEKALQELSRSKALLRRVKSMVRDNTKVDDLAGRLKELQLKVDDLLKHIEEAEEKSHRAKDINEAIKHKITRVVTNLDEISVKNLYTEQRNFNSSRFISRAKRKLENTFANFELLEELMIDLRNKSSLLAEFEATLWQLNSDYRKKYVTPAENHALKLKARAIQLEEIFSETRDVADGPLQAAQAYQRIVEAINSAEIAADNALAAATEAYKAAYPGNPEDSLIRRAKLSVERSKDFRMKGNDLLKSVQQLKEDLERQEMNLAITKDMIDDSHRKLDAMEAIIQKLKSSGISKDILATLNEIEGIDVQSQFTLDRVNSIFQNLTNIRKFTGTIRTDDANLIKEIEDGITFIKGATMKGERLSNNLRHQGNRIEARGNDLRDRIEALKRRIEQTRQHASSIRVSLTTDENGICTRKYRPFLQPSTTNRLTLGYAINSRERNALLLYMGARNSTDFMSVEMINRRIHFTWNAGNGAKTIVHPLRLETNNFQVSDETRWYHITVNRIGNIGELQVRPAITKHSSRKKLYLEPVFDASPVGYSRMDLQTTDSVWIGGVPPGSQSSVTARNFAGCLHYVTIDGEPLGLWNFTESTGCGACNEGFDLEIKEEDRTSFGFNGKGYFKSRNRIRRPKPFYSVVLSFKSLDEDALLFLSVNEQKNQYFSLELEDGRVKFTVQFSEQSRLEMKSDKKLVNLKELIQIQAIVQNSLRNGERMGRLVVGDQDQLGTIKNGPDLDISKEDFYFGGVEPEFNSDRWGKKIELRSLLGCMGSMSVLEVGKNPHTDGQFYGIDPSCPNEPLTNVGFLGDGFVEMPSHVLRKDSSFGFTFKTMVSDTLLMLSTFKGQEDDEDGSTANAPVAMPLRGALAHPPDYYSVSLTEGRLDLRLYAGDTRHQMVSRLRYNDGQLHSFFVLKENRKVRLFVDDEVVNSTRLNRGRQIVEAPDEGGLFFGGMPAGLGADEMVGSSIPFKGCIEDVIINDRVLSFNDPINFDNAFIGRCADLPRRMMGGMESDMKEVMSCQPPRQHTVEYGALKFGDQPESYAIIPINKNSFRTNFNISFEFRSLYPSGLFLLAYNKRLHRRQSRYLDIMSIRLINGRLLISVNRKGKQHKILSPSTALNSGEWRKISISKQHRKISVQIDDKFETEGKLPQKNNLGSQIFIGGFPESLVTKSNLPKYESFRGCLRNLAINGDDYEIPSHSRVDQIVGVGQCFAAGTVQSGSYFPGDAYAVYDNNFGVGPLLELRLEFRTWELDGVLLSVANSSSNVALSLEMLNGAIVFSVNIGHRHPFSAKVALDNRHAFCNNKWHTVSAYYIKDSLTLKVDSYPESYGFNGSTELKKVVAEAPLYIGGIPASAPTGTLVSRENFRGCIRNIALNSEIKDWTNMYKLHHVLLNACPMP